MEHAYSDRWGCGRAVGAGRSGASCGGNRGKLVKVPTSREDEAYGALSRASDARQLGSTLALESESEAPQRETWAPQSGIAPARSEPSRSEPSRSEPSRDAAPGSPQHYQEEDLPHAPALPFFVVAVGASAGGFEALQELFRHVSPDSGLSFVVLQHLPADFKSMMSQLLSRQTALRAVEVEDGQSPLPNCIHVVPPQRVVTLEGGRFRCADRETARVLLPFNALLTSLAETQGDQAVAIVLSGTGSDGTHGARLLKEAGGLVLAQDPASAKFDGMPNSVIQSGTVDFVGTPHHLVERLEQYAQKAMERLASAGGELTRERDAFDEILRLLRQHSRLHFSMYKAPLLLRRIQRRAGLVGEDALGGYLRILKSRPQEVEQLARELLIGVTQFFRDPAAWAYLEDTILPQVLAQGGERGTLRIWVAGCATGEEAYTLAMLLEEQIQKLRRPINYRLFATDVRRDSLRYARAGVYPAAACASIPEPLRERYFEPRGELRVARRSLRDAVTFAPHDLLTEPPFTQLNLVLCRNLLMYLDSEAQHHVLSRLRASLREGGILFLGGSESVGEGSPHFRAINARAGMFLARGSVSGTHSIWPSLREQSLDASGTAVPAPRPGGRSSESLYEAVVQRYAPPGVAVDANFELLQVFGRIADFVSLPPGRVTTSLLKMVPRSLAALLSTAGRKALSQGEEITIPDVRVPTAAGDQLFSVHIAPVEDLPGVALGLLIFFETPRSSLPLPAAPSGDPDGAVRQRVRELEDELLVARENINSAVQDLEANNEELQHTNQELTGSNEELQGTNQELQSVNQELYTVNAEYQEKLAELEETNADLENLLRVVDVGVLFLDERLNIRRFNDSATRVFPLRHEDLGRPLSEIAMMAECPTLAGDVLEVLHTGQRKLLTTLGQDGAWWSIGLRPARDRCGDGSGGVIVTLQEVSELKRAIAELSRLTHAHEIAEAVSGTGHAVLDLSNEVVHFSENARRLLGLQDALPTLDDALGLFQVDPGASRDQALRELMQQQGLPFATERTVLVPPASAARLKLSVHAKLEPNGAELVFALFQRLDPPD
jgi:two-component system, chemotaxis family, CheB/CheR fusion protein